MSATPEAAAGAPAAPTVLCLDDEPGTCNAVVGTLRRIGFEGVPALTVPEALQALARGPVDLVISDYNMPGMNGIEFMHLAREAGYTTPFIILTGVATIEHAVEAMKAGAADYLAKPFGRQQLQLAITRALGADRLRRENEALRRELSEHRAERQVIAESTAMRSILQTVATAAPTRATVLLEGESGTGKEVLARAVHELSDRRGKSFVKLNCAALPEGLIESALFGHEKGAFTGALRRVEGAFERAHGGTLLLDEITEMRLDLQAKLLRVLQEQEFERVGGAHPIRVDVRIVATTNRELGAEVSAGRFRQDLFFRLAVVRLTIPPLRDRPDDIPLLAHRFATRAAIECGKEGTTITPAAMDALMRHRWPGNVRELQHAIERAVILSAEPTLHAYLFDRLSDAPAMPGAHEGGDGRAHIERALAGMSGATPELLNLAELEQRAIARALELTGNNRSQAASLLGINVRTLRRKLNEVQPGLETEAA